MDIAALQPLFWIDPSDPSARTVSGGVITSLANKSPINAVPFSSAAGPMLEAGAFNGRDAARFGGASYLSSGVQDVPSGFVIAALCPRPAAGKLLCAWLSKNSFFADNVTRFPFQLFVTPEAAEMRLALDSGTDYSADVQLSSAISPNAPIIVAAQWSGAQSALFLNQEQVAAGVGCVLSSNILPWTIGRAAVEYAGGVGMSGFVGDLGEFVMLPYVPDGATRGALNLYFATRWGFGTLVGGQAIRATGGAVDAVAIHAWESHEIVTVVTPDAGGDWSTALMPGQYSVTYFADGCAPICHGPYTVTAD